MPLLHRMTPSHRSSTSDFSLTFDLEGYRSSAPTNESDGILDCISERFKEDIRVPTHLSPAYISVEIGIAVFAVIFNVVIVCLYVGNSYTRRSSTNMYIISLAVADFLVGLLGIPAAILTSVGLPENFALCLISTSILLQICTTSIFSLVAVTIDRYLAIQRPLRYQILMSKRKVKVIISLCWISGFLVGFVPLIGCHKGPPPAPRCFFLEVNNLGYLVFIFFSTIVFPSMFMACAYSNIHKEIRRQLRKTATMSKNRMLINKMSSDCAAGRCSNASLHPLTSLNHVSSWKAEVKVFRSLVIVVTAFMVSWTPLYTLNTILYFRPCTSVPKEVFHVFICLSHLNSVWNPLIYAFGTRDFKRALYRIKDKLSH